MSNYGITVDTGGAMRRWSQEELAAFFQNAGAMRVALESMKDSARGLRLGLQGATRSLARMGGAARGLLSGLMSARSVTRGLQAGMARLHRYSRAWWKDFAGTLSRLAANAAYLRNSLAAMAAPLMRALAPAIEFVTDRFVGLFNLVNQFFARLGGASSYVAARRIAGGIEGVGASASHAADGVKALERQLADFDDLNVLDAPEDGAGSGGGSGSGSGGAGVEFEERQIESGLAAFVDSLRSAFEAEDWQGLGTLIGGKINEMVEGVDWAAAGAKVGRCVNGLFSTTYWTLETVNFTNIGARVAEFLNSALAEIDFTTVGSTVALLFTSLAETIAGFVDGFDWKRFAEKLADGVNGFTATLGKKLDALDWAGLALKLTGGLNAFIARTDWAKAGKTLGGRINDLLAILGTASANFNWKGAGDALATAVNNMVKRVNWQSLGDWLSDTLLGMLDFGVAFLQGFDARGFANDIKKALDRVDWDGVSEKLWTLFQTALKKLGEIVGTLLFGGSADVKLNLAVLKDGWQSITAWLGIDKPLAALVGLVKDHWQTIAGWLGIDRPLAALVGLVKDGWTSIGEFVGNAVTVLASLARSDDNQTPGILFDVATALGFKATLGRKDKEQKPGVVFDVATALGFKGALERKDRDQSPEKVFSVASALEFLGKLKRKDDRYRPAKVFKTGDTLGFKGKLSATNKTRDVFDTAITVTATLSSVIKGLGDFAKSVAKKVNDELKKLTGNAEGGVITGGGQLRRFARGGIIGGGVARYLSGVPHYAGGTARAHGTVFVAGEAGPEIMGHINGRTEILNKSQLAQTMYSAVAAAMGRAVSALGTFLSGQLANCTNAIVGTLGNLSGVTNIQYHEPVMATGTVLPYDVAAQIARTGMDIQNTLDTNNEDLIQTIISVIGAQTSAIVAALRTNQPQGMTGGGLTAQDVINDINRRAQMFGGSPLLD